MNNHILVYYLQTICWEVEHCTCTQYTPHVSYYTLLIMNDLTQVQQRENHNANEIHDQLQVESIACYLFIHDVH